MSNPCIAHDCARPNYVRGLCTLHYQRSRKAGTLPALRVRPTVDERLECRLIRQPNGCLEWQGNTIGGYGSIRVGSKKDTSARMVLTHRLAWELANGPIPEGLFICHSCDNPPCCNVAHLFLGTPADNTADMDTKGRRRGNEMKTHCPAKHPYDEANTYVDKTGKRYCRACGQKRAWVRRHDAIRAREDAMLDRDSDGWGP